MMLSKEKAFSAVEEMALILTGFPPRPEAHPLVAKMLCDMIATDKWGEADDKVDWLVMVLRDYVGEWPGTAELRAILSLKWKPADGKLGYSRLPQFLDGLPRELQVPESRERHAGENPALSGEIDEIAAKKRVQ